MSREVKACYKCKTEVVDSSTYRRRPECHQCKRVREEEARAKKKQKAKKYREENHEKIKEGAKRHRENLTEERKLELKAHSQKYYQDHKEEYKKRGKEYYEKNKETVVARHAEWWRTHPGYKLRMEREYFKDPINREKRKQRNRDHYKKNSKEISKKKWEQKKARFAKDIGAKISSNLRVTFSNAIRLGHKRKSVLKLLGCSIPEFKSHIESQFKIGMTWENWGSGMDKWNMDHIIPASSFDMKKEEDQKKCWHYSNFQPLWQKDNMVKSDFLPCGNRASEVGKVGAQYISLEDAS